MINSIAVIGGAAILNRAAGSDLYGLNLPGKSLLYVAPCFAVLSLLCAPWQTAIALGVSYYWWRLWPWGRWLYMDRQPIGYGRTEPPDLLERAIESISFGKARVAMFWRMQFGMLAGMLIFSTTWEVEKIMEIGAIAAGPIFYGFSPHALIFPAVFGAMLWMSYKLAWRLKPANPIPIAEYISGALWGALIAGGCP